MGLSRPSLGHPDHLQGLSWRRERADAPWVEREPLPPKPLCHPPNPPSSCPDMHVHRCLHLQHKTGPPVGIIHHSALPRGCPQIPSSTTCVPLLSSSVVTSWLDPWISLPRNVVFRQLPGCRDPLLPLCLTHSHSCTHMCMLTLAHSLTLTLSQAPQCRTLTLSPAASPCCAFMTAMQAPLHGFLPMHVSAS